MLRVGQRPQLIQNLKHNLGFVSDETINNKILTQYRLYEYLTPCDPDNKSILQSVIDKWSDYVIELWKTTQYEYDPILNYDRTEDTTDKGKHNGGSDTTAVNTPNNRKTITSNGGYNAGSTLKETEQSEIQGTLTDTTKNVFNGTDQNDRHSHIYGNIGIMTTQDMIQKQRDILIDPVEFYVEKFAECFNLSMEVDFYGCMQI